MYNGGTLQYPDLQAPVLTAAQEPEQVTESRWHQPWSEPRWDKVKAAAAIALMVSGGVFVGFSPFGAAPLESNWHQAWSEPVRTKPGLLAALQQPLAAPVTTPAPETVTVDKWLRPLSERLYAKASLPTGEQQALSFSEAIFSEVIFEDKWHQAWSLPPVLAKQGLAAADQQFLALVKAAPFGETILEDKWHQPWSMPVPARFLPAYEQQATAFVSVVIPPPPPPPPSASIQIFVNVENTGIGRRITVAAY